MAFGVTGDTLVNNPLFESEIMCAMTLRFANVDYKKFRVELLQQTGFKARVQVGLLLQILMSKTTAQLRLKNASSIACSFKPKKALRSYCAYSFIS